jgi:hypothetical protein
VLKAHPRRGYLGDRGKIDDPHAGWKGRALRTPFHRETGKGTLPKIVKFQIRSDPLAH